MNCSKFNILFFCCDFFQTLNAYKLTIFDNNLSELRQFFPTAFIATKEIRFGEFGKVLNIFRHRNDSIYWDRMFAFHQFWSIESWNSISFKHFIVNHNERLEFSVLISKWNIRKEVKANVNVRCKWVFGHNGSVGTIEPFWAGTFELEILCLMEILYLFHEFFTSNEKERNFNIWLSLLHKNC